MVIPLGVASAAPNFDRIVKDGETVHEDIVIVGGSLLIEEGATVVGDVTIFGGSAIINGDIEGDVVILGGNTTLSGTVDGDLVVFGGALHANTSAGVGRDCILIGGTLAGDGVGNISCTEVGDFPEIVIPAFVEPPEPPEAPRAPEIPQRSRGYSPQGRGFFGAISSAAGSSMFFGILALIIGYVAPNHLGQVSNTLKRKPVAGGVVGFLTIIAVPSLLVILAIILSILSLVCIGLLGWPFFLVLVIAFVVALLLGWVAAGNLLGQRLAVWLKLSNRSLPVTAALGTAILTLAAGLLSALPFWLGGWFWSILAFLILCTGLGAVALTRFGSRPYPIWAAGNGEKVDAVLETLPVEDDEDFPQKSPVD
jgi:hypothetical protein